MSTTRLEGTDERVVLFYFFFSRVKVCVITQRERGALFRCLLQEQRTEKESNFYIRSVVGSGELTKVAEKTKDKAVVV